jgi:ADP-ribose pyrophosphatase
MIAGRRLQMNEPTKRSSDNDSLFVRAVDSPEQNREITYVQHGGTAGCLCFDPDRDAVLLVEQARPVLSTSLLELPSGRIEENESPYDAAIRETLEETGYRVEELASLGTFFSSVGLTDEVIHLFTTEVFFYEKTVEPELQFRWVSFRECFEMVTEGALRDAKTALAILLLGTLISKTDD